MEDAMNEAAAKEKSLEAAAAKLAPAVAATAVQVEGVTLVPTVAGHIIHSNNVSPEQLHNTAMTSPLLQGITQEQSLAFIQVILTTLQTQATEIAPMMQQTTAAGANLQVHQMQQQAGQPVEDEWTDGDMDEDEKELEEANRKEGDVVVRKKKRILKSQKKLGKTTAK